MKLPRQWRRLLAWAASPDDRDEIIESLDAEASELAEAVGEAAARRWYRRQVRRSLIPLLLRRATLALPVLSGALTMSDLSSDLVFTFRRMWRRPIVPAVVTLTMALGIAAVTSVFSVADAVLFRPIPLPDSSRIVRFYTTIHAANGAPMTDPSVNYFDVNDIGTSSRTLTAVAPYTTTSFTWVTDSGPESVAALRVGEHYLDVLGVGLQRGHWFAPSSFHPGGDDGAIVTDSFWRRALGAREDVIGQTLDLNGRRVHIDGVLASSPFLFPSLPEIWVPLAVAPDSYLNNRGSVSLGAIARVSPRHSVAEASQELATIEQGLKAAYPLFTGGRTITIRPMGETLSAPVRPTLMLLIAVVAVVLLIAAANIADLLITEASSRRHEFAIRGALGAGTARLMRQILVETLALMMIGAALGVLTAPLLTSQLVALYPTALPRATEISLNLRALSAAIAATMLAGALVTLPLMRASSRVRLEADLRAGGRGGSGHQTRRLASALVVAQVAVTMVVVAAGVVLLRTFVNTASRPVGFTAEDMLVFNISLSGPRYEAPEAANRFYDEFLPRISAMPGVSAVGVTQFLPFSPGMWGDSFARVGEPDVAPKLPGANIQFISPTLPQALDTPIVAGRGFTAQDVAGHPLVALVNETLAKRSFGGKAVGRSIVWQKQTLEIVGVIGDVRHSSLVEPADPEIYLPWAQQQRASGWVVVRASQLDELPQRIKEQLRQLDPRVPMTKVGTMESRMASVVGPERFRATLAGAVGTAGLGLAILGLYGLSMHRVRQQSREIAIRLALGEAAGRVRQRVVLSAVKLSVAGVVIGLGASLWTGRLIQEFLITGERANDPLTLFSVSAILLVVALASAWVPAQRASRTDPLEALRQD